MTTYKLEGTHQEIILADGLLEKHIEAAARTTENYKFPASVHSIFLESMQAAGKGLDGRLHTKGLEQPEVNIYFEGHTHIQSIRQLPIMVSAGHDVYAMFWPVL